MEPFDATWCDPSASRQMWVRYLSDCSKGQSTTSAPPCNIAVSSPCSSAKRTMATSSGSNGFGSQANTAVVNSTRSPSVRSPSPRYSRSDVHKPATSRRPCVSVPVLSVQITVVEPNVSTDGRRRTSARCCASRHAPIARYNVYTIENSSGIAAMARLTPAITAAPQPSPWSSSAPIAAMQNTAATTASERTSDARPRCSGVGGCFTDATSAPILP